MAAPQIRYALSQLSSRNGHHEFEHLCRELARMRITPNILPATGPVSAGGDQGRDFETFRTWIQERLPDSFLASETDLRIVFACTLQRENLAAKIKKDLQAIAGSDPVDRVYFFCEQDIPVAKRHELRKRAQQDHGIDIEIIDGQALSELLAAEDCLWIAERYLGIRISRGLPGTERPGERSAATVSWTAGTEIDVGAIHGDINIYNAEPAAASGARHRRRTFAAPDRPRKHWRTASLSLAATAAVMAVPVLILAPWRDSLSSASPRGHVSVSPRSPVTVSPRRTVTVSPQRTATVSPRRTATVSPPSPGKVSPKSPVTVSPRPPGTVLDDIAGREWSGTVVYDLTFLDGHSGSIPLTLSVDFSPSTTPGTPVGSILYGEGCPSESVTLIGSDPKVLTLASKPPAGPIPDSCQGSSRGALWLSGKQPSLTITLVGTDPHDEINVLATISDSSTMYTGILNALN